MDTREILDTIRLYSGLEGENDIGGELLLRVANIGFLNLGIVLNKFYNNYLFRTKTYTSHTGNIEIPGDSLRVTSVMRKDSNENFQPATWVEPEESQTIDHNQNREASELHPLYTQEGNEILMYPALSSTDAKLKYRKKMARLIEGRFTWVSTTTGTFEKTASFVDDVYNGYEVVFYNDKEDTIELYAKRKIDDYNGNSRTVTIDNTMSNVTEGHIRYALVPIIPVEFHALIVDATLSELRRIPKFAEIVGGESWTDTKAYIKSTIKDALEVRSQ